MYKLIVLADDFTGALDTGVQFSKRGISTLVTTNKEYDLKKSFADVQVLVINLESRHLRPEKAYEDVANVTKWALEAGIKNIYKKTDSGLRGNIGSELTAIVDASGGKNISFIPAFPKAKRTTEKGFHYIDGVPVTQTVFGKDPFEPVKNDNVADIIREQSSIETCIVTIDEIDSFTFEEVERTVVIFDAVTDEDMEAISKKIEISGMSNTIAGCAGFAEQLPNLLGIDADDYGEIDVAEGLIVVSGSINQVTLEQIDYACQQGFQTITLKPEEKLADNILNLPQIQDLIKEIEMIYQKEGRIIIEAARSKAMVELTDHFAKQMGFTVEEARQRIACNLGRLIGSLSQQGVEGTFIVFGGDTLKAVMDSLGCDGIIPLWEIDNGIVFSKAIRGTRMINIISKSGGFGDIDTLVKIEDFLDRMSVNAIGL